MLKIRFLAAMLVAASAAAPASAEPANNEVWVIPANPDSLREGRFDVPVSKEKLKLISFLGYREDFYDQDVDLKVRFWPSRGSTHVYVVARELLERQQYRMEAEPLGWRQGRWNEWGPWPTEAWLRRENIPPSNLGLVVHLDEIAGKKVAPAFVYYSELPKVVDTYSMHLRTNEALTGVSYSLHRGGKVLRRKKLDLGGDVYGGEPFEIILDVSEIPEGRLKIKIKAQIKNQGEPAVREYEFYHQPFE